MNAESVGRLKRLPKKLWHLGKSMAKLARKSHEYLRVAHTSKMQIARIEQDRDKKLDAIKQEQKLLIDEIFSFALSRKEEIMKRGKSVILATGQVGWRTISPSVEIEEGSTEKTVIQWLSTRYKKYLRYTPKLNREKILQDSRDGVLRNIQGIRIREGEEFFIAPAPRGKNKPETIVIDIPS